MQYFFIEKILSAYIYRAMLCICLIYSSAWFTAERVLGLHRSCHCHFRGSAPKIGHRKLNSFWYHWVDEFPSGFYHHPVSNWNTGDQGRLQLKNLFSGILGVEWPFGAALSKCLTHRFCEGPSSCSKPSFCFQDTMLVLWHPFSPSLHTCVHCLFSLLWPWTSDFMLPSFDCRK